MNVFLPYDNVMVTCEDREAPLGCRDILDPRIEQWLDSHCGDDWDYEFKSHKTPCDSINFQLPDLKIVLMFKLTWGGQ